MWKVWASKSSTKTSILNHCFPKFSFLLTFFLNFSSGSAVFQKNHPDWLFSRLATAEQLQAQSSIRVSGIHVKIPHNLNAFFFWKEVYSGGFTSFHKMWPSTCLNTISHLFAKYLSKTLPGKIFHISVSPLFEFAALKKCTRSTGTFSAMTGFLTFLWIQISHLVQSWSYINVKN